MEASKDFRPFELRSLSELRFAAEDAAIRGDYDSLGMIVEESRLRDRWDDTDLGYTQLIEDCSAVIRDNGPGSQQEI